ncbi:MULTISPECIES: hypothetical protein [unclassified Streptomyces]|uniref:hypothetical protein n=1 Tax=unclassified Streptomyces TaxID=2593676 RepID=UPI00366464A8
MTEKRGGGRIYGLWITMMIFFSGRATVWPYLAGRRFAQDIAILALMLLVYLLGFAGGSRSPTASGQTPPTGSPIDATEDPSA